MPSCPDCGAEMKWRNPFYVCTICGLALRKHEYERYKQKKEDETFQARYDEEDDSKKQKDYLKWFIDGDRKR